MNSQEKRIKKSINATTRRVSKGWAWRELQGVQCVKVKLAADGTYSYVSGPELHSVGAPVRKRRVWAVRYGCDEQGTARGGFGWELTQEEAIANLAKYARGLEVAS